MQFRIRNRAIIVVGLAALVVSAVALKRPMFEQFWLWKLQSDDQATRDSAARRLGEMGSVRAIPPLIELFLEISPTTYPSEWVRIGNGRFETREIGGGLAETRAVRGDRPVEGKKVVGWQVAMEALTKIGAPVVPSLLELLGDHDATVRSRAIGTLRLIGPGAKAAVPALVRELEDPDATDKATVAYALRGIGPGAKAAVPALLHLLDNKSRNLRLEVALALWTIVPTRESVPALVDALADDDEHVRGCVADALRMRCGCVGDARSRCESCRSRSHRIARRRRT